MNKVIILLMMLTFTPFVYADEIEDVNAVRTDLIRLKNLRPEQVNDLQKAQQVFNSDTILNKNFDFGSEENEIKTENYADGTVKNRSTYKNGQLNGLAQRYDESGTLREELTYINGIEEGEHKQFDEKGKLLAQWTDRNGKRDGVYRSYFADGTLAEERPYVAGVFMDASGKPYNGAYEVKYPDGKIYKKFTYKDGLSEGLFQTYAPTGFLLSEYYFVKDKMQGVATRYDEHTGEALAKIPYKDDKVDGSLQTFQNGKLFAELPYANGKISGVGKKYEEDGGHWETMFVDNVAQGENKFYDAKNRLRTMQMMHNDEQVGDTILYDTHGKAYPKPIILNPEQHKVLFFGLWFIAFLFSLTIHEAAHAWAALKLGDKTAYEGGQVTINPIPHIRREPFGMFVLPILTYWGQGWMIGWASAPYNPQWALAHPRRCALMALAGPLSNLILVCIAALFMRLGLASGFFTIPDTFSATAIFGGVSPGVSAMAASFLGIFFFLNIILFAFNLLPLPPLDGAGAVPLILPRTWSEKYMAFVNHRAVSIVGLIAAWMSFGYISGPIINICIACLFLGV